MYSEDLIFFVHAKYAQKKWFASWITFSAPVFSMGVHQSSKKCCTAAPSVRAEQGSCEPISQLKAHMRERDGSKGSWTLAHSSERVRERERDQLTRLLNSCSQLRARSRERSAHKALDLLLTAHSAFKRKKRERSAHKAQILIKQC